MKTKSFLGGAVILAAAGFIVRVLGFLYRIYLSNLIGAEGMGLFQLISPVYSLVILTLTSGISTAVSKMTAEELAKKHFANPGRIASCALLLIMISGVAVSAFMFVKMDFITGVILKDARTYYSMLLLVPCIPVVAAASVLKGYYYGAQDVAPTAFSQIAEQIVRIGLVMLTAHYFLGLGLEYACALATVSMALGEIANLAVLFIIYKTKGKKTEKTVPKAGIMRKRTIMLKLAEIALPVSSNRLVMSAMSAAEVLLIPRRLVAGGLGYRQSMELFGKLEGMAIPVLFFPSLITSSLATTLVPAVSEAMSVKNIKSANYRISNSIRITCILGFVFTAIFLAYNQEIGGLLYKKEDIGNILRMFSFACMPIYLQQVLLGVMNGLGKQGVSLRNTVAGYAVRIAVIYFLMPSYGIGSYALGLIISSVLVCAMDIAVIMKTTGLPLDAGNWFLKPCLVCIFMALAGRYPYDFFRIFAASPIWAVLPALACNLFAALYLMALVGALETYEILRLAGIKKHKNLRFFKSGKDNYT